MTLHDSPDGLTSSPAIHSDATNEKVPQPIQEVEHSALLIGWRLNIFTFALSLSVLLVGLDFTLLATAAPTITTDFESLLDVSWYGSAYFMSICACQLLAGNLFERFPHKWVYISFVVVFEAGSLMCALAASSNVLIVGRALSGVGASGLCCGPLIVIATCVSGKLQSVCTGIVQMTWILSEIIGPVIGGAFTQHVTWRWCFYLNLPIGGLTILIIFLILDSRAHQRDPTSIWQRIRSLDYVGFIFFSGAILMLLLAFQWGGVEYSWKSSTIIGLFCGSVCTLATFVGWQLQLQEKACIPPSLFAQKTMVFGFFVATFGNGGFYVILYYLQIWFQSAKDATPFSGGLMYLPTVVTGAITAVVAGGLVSRSPYHNPFLLFGLVCFAIGSGLDTTLQVDSVAGQWIGFQILCGLGFALLVQMPIVAVQRGMPKHQVAMGSTLIIFAQSFSASVFLSIGQTVFQSRLRINLSTDSPSADANIIITDGVAGLRTQVPAHELAGILHAYNSSITSAFFVAVFCSVVALICAAFMPWTRFETKAVAEAATETAGGSV